MSKIEKIRQEIERLKQMGSIGLNEYDAGFENGRGELCDELLAFIDSLPKEHFRDSTKMVSEDLEEAADSQIRKMVDAAGHPGWDWTTQDVVNAFIAGAKWQKAKDDEEREENKRKENELPRFYGD